MGGWSGQASHVVQLSLYLARRMGGGWVVRLAVGQLSLYLARRIGEGWSGKPSTPTSLCIVPLVSRRIIRM